jgi:hypothetical protein
MDAPYQLHWLACTEHPGLAERFFVPGFEGRLPFLLEGAAPSAAEAAEVLSEDQLLPGLLTGLAESDHAGRLVLRMEDQATLLELLEIMRQGFSFDDVEEMVIELSGGLRARHGVSPSCAALSTGVLLAPASSKLKADLLLDLWNVARAAGEDPQAVAFLSQIPSLFEALDAAQVPDATLEACAYMTLAARHLLGGFAEEGSLEEFLVAEVVERVHHPMLKPGVQAVVQAEQAGRRLALEDLHVD